MRERNAGAQHLHRAGMPKLVSMDLLRKLRTLRSCRGGMFVQQVGDVVLAHLVAATCPDREGQRGCCLGGAGVELASVVVEMACGLVHQGNGSAFAPFAGERHAAGADRGVDIGRGQVEDFLDPCCGIEGEQDEGGVPATAAGVLPGCADQRVDGGHAQPVRSPRRCSGGLHLSDTQPDRHERRAMSS